MPKNKKGFVESKTTTTGLEKEIAKLASIMRGIAKDIGRIEVTLRKPRTVRGGEYID